MDKTNFVLEWLKQRGVSTPLEQDILDTYHELTKNPFDMKSAYQQAAKNDVNYKDICAHIAVMPTTVAKSRQNITDIDVRYNLSCQLSMLVEKEWVVLKGGK